MKKLLLSFLIASSLSANAQTNYALSFNGTNYVDCGNSSSLNANSIRTMECWVKFNDLTGSQEILSKSITSQGIELLIFGGNLSAYFMRDGTNYSFIAYPTSNLSTGVWYHIAVSWDGTKENIRLYVNGVSVGSRTDGGNINTTGLTNPSGSFRIGNWADASTRYLNGVVDEARVWNVNRTQAQIKSAMFSTNANQTGLVAYYKMDQGSGTSLTNSTSVTGVNGTLVNSPSWITSPTKKSTNAVSFDGTNDLVNLGTTSSLHFTSNFTAELWVKPTSWTVSELQQLISCHEAGGYAIRLNSNGTIDLAIRISPTTTDYITASYPVTGLANNTWYHVAASFDGRYMRLYVGGNLVATNDLGSSGNTVKYTYPNNPVFVGADPTQTATPQGLYFNGQIDEVRLWNVARTQAQIQASMNTELDPADATQTTGLVSYYTFNQGTAASTNTGLVTVIDQTGTNNGSLTNFALTGATSNYVAQQTTLVALPVTYLSFTAQKQGSQVQLQWSTAQEQNSSHFVLQHSTDNRNWKSIGSIPAVGNSDEVHNYEYTHATPAAGLNLYRIEQVDRDGKSSYSQIAKLNIDGSAGQNLLYNSISNNKIQLQLERPAAIALYSHDGKLLMRKQYAGGLHIIDASGFAKGIYLLRIGNHTEKIILH